MKRKALLAITGCTPKSFETYSQRGRLPFAIPSDRWSEYTMTDALELKILMRAAELTDLDNASKLARSALDKISPLNPFSYCGDEELFAALVRYDWPEKPEDWEERTVVGGRWQDIEAETRQFITEFLPGARLTGTLIVPVKQIADELLIEAHEFGLPEAAVQPVPEDLTGFPDWFVEKEQARRAMLRKLNP